MANIESIVDELRRERDRIDQAIAALTSVSRNGRRGPGRPPGSQTSGRKRRRMSAAARAKIAAAQRARWAKQKAAAKKGGS